MSLNVPKKTPPATGVILAGVGVGGWGENKALLPLGTSPLIAHVIRRCAALLTNSCLSPTRQLNMRTSVYRCTVILFRILVPWGVSTPV